VKKKICYHHLADLQLFCVKGKVLLCGLVLHFSFKFFGKDDENNVQIIFWVKKDKALSSCLIVLKQKKNTSETLFCTNQSNERDNQCYINVVWNNNSALIFKKYAYVRYSFLKNLVLLDLTNIYKIVRIDYKPKNTTFVCKKCICYMWTKYYWTPQNS